MIYVLLIVASFLPLLTFAQTIDSILEMFIGFMGYFVALGVSVALLVFIWGIVQMIFGMGSSGGDPEKVREEGKKRMVWGIVGLFMIVSIWGIVAILMTLFGVTVTGSNIQPPPEINL